jgi:TRAP-type C4-dicarboxylate transport system permease large subunit
METIVLFAALFGLMALGLPIWVATGASALITVGFLALGDATSLPTAMVKGVGSFELLAIPFFILTGELLNRAGLTERIVRLLMFFLGRFRGGLAYASVGVNLFASGVSGSAPADAAAVSAVMLPAMRREGYRPEYAAAVNASAAIIGPIMPPSIPVNLMIGLLTWPVGALLYVLTKMSDVPFGRLALAVGPFLVVMGVVLLLIALVPPLVTWLPNLAFGQP